MNFEKRQIIVISSLTISQLWEPVSGTCAQRAYMETTEIMEAHADLNVKC